ncbi:probable cytochrome P450 304a1 [Anopheles maculipalpis]|uniref:probable cytochrome P450 304a1 n=1 Tax=Anopheles maculipalpis TaxID=1496333 RepID=UPI0021591007|nr:probable cytochrome P450 304a1 [Anopheles maculipalpis]
MAIISVFLWSAVILLLAYRFYLHNIKRPANYPPGPPRLPIFEDYGLLLLLNHRHLHRAASKLARFYKTKVLGLSLAGYPTIIVQDHDIARKLLARRELDGRPNIFLAQLRQKEFKLRGINFIDGTSWKDQRWFFLRHLRDYGFGRRSERYEKELEEELHQLVDLLASGPRYDYERDFIQAEGFVKCPDVFLVTFSNMFLQLAIGERYERARAKSLVQGSRNGLLFARNADDYGTIYSYFPWLRFIFPFSIKYNKIRGGMMGLCQLIEVIVNKQMETFDAANPRHFVDVYLREMQNHFPQDNEVTFQYDQLVLGLADFILPATSGVAVQLSMILERLLLNPEVAKRMQQEIDDVVDSDRLPTLDDRTNLPYTEATLRECLRIDTLIPSGLVHRAQQNVKFEEYNIPANTLLLFNLDSINNQKDVWGDPDAFRPDRFLDETTGSLVLSRDRSLTFSMGKRECPGQTYTRNTIFLILATLMQRFNLSQRKSDPLPDISKRRTGLLYGPDDFWIRFVPRQTI